MEYNQLDPLLSSQGDCKGDVADPSTGYSPYPGNANNIVIEMGAYARTLRGEDQGVVIEFVNPKYKDETRTEFKKPTRVSFFPILILWLMETGIVLILMMC